MGIWLNMGNAGIPWRKLTIQTSGWHQRQASGQVSEGEEADGSESEENTKESENTAGKNGCIMYIYYGRYIYS